jgi:hypothetical protein
MSVAIFGSGKKEMLARPKWLFYLRSKQKVIYFLRHLLLYFKNIWTNIMFNMYSSYNMLVIKIFVKLVYKVLIIPTIQFSFLLNSLYILELYFKHIILSPLSHNTEILFIVKISKSLCAQFVRYNDVNANLNITKLLLNMHIYIYI